MALNDSEVYLPATGRIYTAAVDTSFPTDLTAPGASWYDIGHTSEEDLPSWGSDGGDQTRLGTWQKRTLRMVETDPALEILTFNVHQFNKLTLAYYYGKAATGTANRYEYASGSANTGNVSLLIVVSDGENGEVAFHAPNVTLGREGNVEADAEAFLALPLRATVLDPVEGGTVGYKFAWGATTLAVS